MRARFCLFLFLLLVAATPACSRKFSPEGQGFSVAFPGKPVEEPMSVTDGRRVVRGKHWKLESGNVAYYMSCVNYGGIVDTSQSVQPIYDMMRDALLANHADVQVIKDEMIADHGLTGREFIYRQGDVDIVIQVFVNDVGRAFQVAGAHKTGDEKGRARCYEFIESLELER